ncbi:MAG TPA: O-antigen ligase family protein [Opitutaceae bacterium]|nr:O-antigen ligase family protein [Opitutaceae bacterium]
MSPRLRLTLFLALGAAIGIIVAADISDEQYGFAVVVALLACWVIIERVSDAPPDAWLLCGVLIGYVVGNRGFAQLQPSGQIPLLPAEAVLLVAIPALIVRMAMKRAAGFRMDCLNVSLLIWILYGTVRLPIDINRFGIMAVRDYAMVYYAAFFYIGQAFGSHAASARLLKRALTTAFVALLPVVVSIQLFPDFLLENFTWRGIPLIYQKSDLIATSLAAGFFWLWTRRNPGAKYGWPLLAAASLLLIGVMVSPRAAMAAAAITTLLWLLVGRWRIAAAQLAIVLGGSALTLAVLSFAGKDLRTSAPYSAFEHAVSIFDPEGRGSYINAESGDPGSNNRFRWIWWTDVCKDTTSTNPVFGLGFGSDLAARFMADYDLLSDETFAARSPHSMIVTTYGRMGFLGLALWIAVSASMARVVWRLFRRGDPDGLGLASAACVIWISACVGVVLESPMGAVIFWTVVGLANSSAQSLPAAGGESPRARLAEAAPEEWPVAKAGALDTESGIR